MVKFAWSFAGLLLAGTANAESAVDELAESAADTAQEENTCSLSGQGSCVSPETIRAPVEMNMIDTSKGCTDTHHSCPLWAELGECEQNAHFMFKTCAFSCKSCVSATRLYGIVQKPQEVSELSLIHISEPTRPY